MARRTQVIYPETRYLLPSGAALAAVLGVRPQAVSKAHSRDRIDVREDGCWDLFDVLADWRRHTRWSLQRARAGLPPWLDLDLPVTQGMVDELVRRARARGGTSTVPTLTMTRTMSPRQ